MNRNLPWSGKFYRRMVATILQSQQGYWLDVLINWRFDRLKVISYLQLHLIDRSAVAE